MHQLCRLSSCWCSFPSPSVWVRLTVHNPAVRSWVIINNFCSIFWSLTRCEFCFAVIETFSFFFKCQHCDGFEEEKTVFLPSGDFHTRICIVFRIVPNPFTQKVTDFFWATSPGELRGSTWIYLALMLLIHTFALVDSWWWWFMNFHLIVGFKSLFYG